VLVVKVPVARKLPPAVMVISPPFLPSALIFFTSMSLLALRVTAPPFPPVVDVASMDPVLMLEDPTYLTSPAVILTFPESPFWALDPALISPVSTFPVKLVTVMVMLPPAVVLELELRAPVVMSPLASRAIAPPFVVRSLPISTFPVTLVTVMLPPAVVLELELRAPVVMSPLASRAIAPPLVVRSLPTARLLAA